MYAGEIIEIAAMATLLANPQHPYTLALMEASADPDAKNALVMRDVPPGEPPSLVNPPSGCRFNPRCKHMMPGLCDVKRPPMFKTEENHDVLCWLFDEGVQAVEHESG
jgi:peptide/nickel transport system ATP-binding protein